MRIRFIQLPPLLVLLVVALACQGAEVTPPCTPLPGSDKDPCAAGPPLVGPTGENASIIILTDLGDFLHPDRLFAAHLVVRGSYTPGTVRCTANREPYRGHNWQEFPPGWPLLVSYAAKCYAQFEAAEYIVGGGPRTLTVMPRDQWYLAGHHDEVGEQHRSELEHILLNGGACCGITVREGGITADEIIIGLAPATDLSVETWEVVFTWDVQRSEDGSTILAVNPYRHLVIDSDVSVLQPQLSDFIRDIKAEHTKRMDAYGGRIGEDEDLPMLTTNANQLRTFFTSVGAYTDPDNPPAQPPPVPIVCGKAVPDAANNTALVKDCAALAAFRDGLDDTSKLDWSSSTPIGQWEGVTVGGTPKRVQRLDLDDLGLDGALPADLGNLTGLTWLDLDYNELRGAIPATLGNLTGLTTLSLSANDLTGAIPTALGKLTRLTTLDLADNELTGAPPAELGNLRAVTYLSLGGNDLTGPVPAWVSGLRNLQELYLDGNGFTGAIPTSLAQLTGLQVLALGGNRLTGTIPPVLGNLKKLEELALQRNQLTGTIPVELLALPDLEYLYLSGNQLTGCVPAGLLNVSTNDLARLNLPTCPNQAPVFAQASYAFQVARNAAVGTAVGAVSATDADAGDAVSYAVTAGNGGGEFAVDAGTGSITVAKALGEGAAYTLTVRASDRNRGTATVTVSITTTT